MGKELCRDMAYWLNGKNCKRVIKDGDFFNFNDNEQDSILFIDGTSIAFLGHKDHVVIAQDPIINVGDHPYKTMVYVGNINNEEISL